MGLSQLFPKLHNIPAHSRVPSAKLPLCLVGGGGGGFFKCTPRIGNRDDTFPSIITVLPNPPPPPPRTNYLMERNTPNSPLSQHTHAGQTEIYQAK